MNPFRHASSEEDKIHTQVLIKTSITSEYALDGMLHCIP